MNISELELDPALVEEGVWRELDDAAVKIASVEKKSYQNKLGRLMAKEMMKSSRVREMEAIKQQEMQYKAMVGTIIMGIRGFTNDKLEIGLTPKELGAEVEFTDANVLKMLQVMPRFRRLCLNESADEDNYRLKEVVSADGDDGQMPAVSPEARLKSGDAVPA